MAKKTSIKLPLNLKVAHYWFIYWLVMPDLLTPNTTVHNTVLCRYNAVNFLTNINKRHQIPRPLGRGMGCFMWMQHLVHILPQFIFCLSSYNHACNILRYNGTRLYVIRHQWINRKFDEAGNWYLTQKTVALYLTINMALQYKQQELQTHVI